MHIAIWKPVNDIIITHLKKLNGHFFKKLFAAMFYGFISALIVLLIGAIVFLITLISVGEDPLGIFLLYILCVIIAYNIFIFDFPSISVKASTFR